MIAGEGCREPVIFCLPAAGTMAGIRCVAHCILRSFIQQGTG